MSEQNKKKREYQKSYREAEKHISQMQICQKKVYYKIAIVKIFFVRSFINF